MEHTDQERNWTGIESRDAVKRQFECATHVVELSSDEDDLPHSGSPPPKRRRLGNDLWASCEQRPSEATINEAYKRPTGLIGSFFEHEHIPANKRHLFQSTRSVRGHFQEPGPPTPPESLNEDTYPVEDVSHALTTDTTPMFNESTNDNDVGAAVDLSMRMSRYFDSPRPRNSLSARDRIFNHSKARLEAEGIERSRELRKRREQQTKIHAKADNTSQSSLASILHAIDRDPNGIAETTIGALAPPKPKTREENTRCVREPVKFDFEKHDTLPSARTRSPEHSYHNRSELHKQPPEQRNETDGRSRQSPCGPFKTNAIQSINFNSDDEQRGKDERLRRMMVTALGPHGGHKQKNGKSHITRCQPAVFRTPDLSNGREIQSELTAAGCDALRRLMGIKQQAKLSNAQDGLDNDSNSPGFTNDDVTEAANTPKVSLAVLQKFKGHEQNGPHVSYNDLLPQGSELTLPPNFASRPLQIQTSVREREILKERAKDFEAISKAFEAFASLGALRQFKDIELKELDELSQFCDAVFNRSLSGRRARQRILNIASNTRTRVKSIGLSASVDKVNKILQSILKSDYARILDVEGDEIKTKINQITEAVHQSSKKRRTNLSEVMSVDDSEVTTSFKKASRKNSALNRFSKTDAKIAAMEKVLANFERNEVTQNSNGYDSDVEVMDLSCSQSHHEAEDSEEDGGEETMRPIGFDIQRQDVESLTIYPSNVQEHAQICDAGNENTPEQQADVMSTQAATSPHITQTFDQSLFDRMQSKQHEQVPPQQQSFQALNHDLLQQNIGRQLTRTNFKPSKTVAKEREQSLATFDPEPVSNPVSDEEFDDDNLDAVSTEDEAAEPNDEKRPQCWRYLVRLIGSNGFSAEIDGCQSEEGRFLSYKMAKDCLQNLVMKMKDNYRNQHRTNSDRCWNSQVTEDGENYDFVMTHTSNAAHACHFRIERELYSPSEEAYQKAKVKAACQPVEMWFVDWERVVEPHIEQEEEENDHTVEEHDQNAYRSDDDPLKDDYDQERQASIGADQEESGTNEHIQEDNTARSGQDADAEEETIINSTGEISNPPAIQAACEESITLDFLPTQGQQSEGIPHISNASEVEQADGNPAPDVNCTSEDKAMSINQTHVHKHDILDSGSAASLALSPQCRNIDNDVYDDLDDELFGPDSDSQDQDAPLQLLDMQSLSTVTDAGAVDGSTVFAPLAQQLETMPDIESLLTAVAETTNTTAIITANADCQAHIEPESETTRLLEHSSPSASATAVILPEITATVESLQAPAELQCPPETTITRMSGDTLITFNSISLANRYASECFLGWFTQQASVMNNEELIETTMSQIEEELEFHGGLELWQRKGQFTFVDDNGWEMVERFKVWVRKSDSRGPSN